jgi:hypothetical protein
MKFIKPAFGMLLIGSVFFIIYGCEKSEDDSPSIQTQTVNVFARTFSAPSSAWVDGSDFWYIHLGVPELTSSNLDSAAIQVFFSTGNNGWTALPYTHVKSSGNYFMGFITTVGIVEVRWTHNTGGNGDEPNTVFGEEVKFKVVVIPPSAKLLKQNIDYNNYEEISKVFDLKDSR